ncbi:3212_t:CDS:2 [Paraglomus occultum]|uniref:3212_t:CDS:1 n=1 Tax=Paraglomus occultum TaxID=144539 RepID=A0A9N9CDT5_9GLOM|nr:3212_t:CDS:2 [Paraglomus occultum]
MAVGDSKDGNVAVTDDIIVIVKPAIVVDGSGGDNDGSRGDVTAFALVIIRPMLFADNDMDRMNILFRYCYL